MDARGRNIKRLNIQVSSRVPVVIVTRIQRSTIYQGLNHESSLYLQVEGVSCFFVCSLIIIELIFSFQISTLNQFEITGFFFQLSLDLIYIFLNH